MFQIGNFLVSPDAVEYLPESVARENTALALKVTAGTIEILMTDHGEATRDLIQKLQFILNKDIVPRFADAKTIRKGLNVAYPAGQSGPSAPSSPSSPPGRRAG